MFKLKTSTDHINHKLPCDCATTIEEAMFECTICGAHYTSDLMTFPIFRCYDCGGTIYKFISR